MSDFEYIESKAKTAPRYGSKLEHAIVRHLIRTLNRAGFAVHSVAHDDYMRTRSARAALFEVFEVDECTLRFSRKGARDGVLHGVLLIGGNGRDIVSDWTIDPSREFDRAVWAAVDTQPECNCNE